mgnify:FL=1
MEEAKAWLKKSELHKIDPNDPDLVRANMLLKTKELMFHKPIHEAA